MTAKQSLILARETARRWAAAITPTRPLESMTGLASFVNDYRAYRSMVDPADLRAVRLLETYPCLSDSVAVTPFDPHYFYQAVWATNGILMTGVSQHVDVGSQVLFVALLASSRPVTFVDIRPLDAVVPGLTSVPGSVLDLPFADRSVDSLSALHVVEHVGLGRYGDPLNPKGTEEACAELARVVAPGGTLWLSMPVGHPRTVFNAHRITDPRVVPQLVDGLELSAFAYVDDGGKFHAEAAPGDAADASYACGMYRFVRP